MSLHGNGTLELWWCSAPLASPFVGPSLSPCWLDTGGIIALLAVFMTMLAANGARLHFMAEKRAAMQASTM
jgi:hypothetical protein